MNDNKTLKLGSKVSSEVEIIPSDTPILFFETSEEFEQWMEENHKKVQAIWIKIAKKSSKIQSINYDQSLDVALCFGWIDGVVNKFDDKFYIQRFTPRRPKSIWSKRNTEHIERLTKQGKMKDAGLQQVQLAKQDGRWDRAYHPASTATLPKAFMLELNKNQKAKQFYESLSSTNKYAIFYRLTTAKKDETRKRWEERILQMLEKGETFH